MSGMHEGTRWFSLRRRLLALLLGGLTVGWLAIVAATYFDAHEEVDALLDAQLAQVAQTLLALASEYDDDDDVVDLAAASHKYQNAFVFQLWDDAGHLLLRSRQAPLAPLVAGDGFVDAAGPDGQRWRYFSQWSGSGRIRVIVGEYHRVREALAGDVVGRLLALSLFGLPLLGAWAWYATRRGLAPIDAVADQVMQRAPEHLAPVAPATAPQELRPLVEALNTLLSRVAQAFENERRFTADAAHELRTPLAALVTQAQVAMRAHDAAERSHALEQLAVSARRASHLVDQLLTLARLDPAAGLERSPVAFDMLAAEVCADHGAMALGKGIELALDAVPATVSGNAALLRTLLRNLIDNALRHTPPGGKVDVGVTADAGDVVLTVSDSGPGIPVEARQAVLQRFHRLAGQEVEGSGLGLSIVARIAEMHGATLSLGEGCGQPGLTVRVAFPFSVA